MTPRTVVLGLGLAALLAGCGSGSSGGPVTTPTPTVVTATPTLTPSPRPTHTHTARPTPSPSPSPTVTVTVAPPVSGHPCSSSHLALSLGTGQGTAGTTYQLLVLTNTGTAACTLFGYPGVSFITTSGAIIGLPSSRDPGRVRTISLAPGGAANAVSRQPNAGNFSPSACKAKTADRVRVYPPGETVPLFAQDSFKVCSTAAGRTGIGPMLAGTGG